MHYGFNYLRSSSTVALMASMRPWVLNHLFTAWNYPPRPELRVGCGVV